MPTLKETRNELYIMMIEIIVQEPGSKLDNIIMSKQDERSMVQKLLNKIAGHAANTGCARHFSYRPKSFGTFDYEFGNFLD